MLPKAEYEHLVFFKVLVEITHRITQHKDLSPLVSPIGDINKYILFFLHIFENIKLFYIAGRHTSFIQVSLYFINLIY